MFKNVVKEEIIIPAQMSYLKQVRNFIDHIGKKYRFTDKVINSFKLVVDESCTNIIRHGYRDIRNGQIVVRAIVRRLSLTMVIIDHGKSFDPRQVKNPDLQKYVSIGKKGGLGIFMIRKLMDDIKYNVTNRGNELRLTKMREKVDRAKPLMIWDSFTLRTKFTLITCLIMTILSLVSFFIFNSRIEQNTREQVFSNGHALSENLAKISWTPMNNENLITLTENAQSVKESNPGMVTMAMITDNENRPQTTVPIKEDLFMLGMNGQSFDVKSKTLVDTIKKTEVYRYRFSPDSVIYSFISPIDAPGLAEAPLGFAHVWVNQKYIEHKISNTRLNLILILVVALIIGSLGSFILITLIMDPFHKLAGWVRQVGHGTVDEDELDIDAGDELGEIAQAFNEMTGKFREAQVSLMEQQRMQRELQVAQEIQQMLLPTDFPNVIGYDITSYYQAAKEVGGDLFDFVEVDDHTLGICVADVSGKGVPGSMVMTMIRTALRLEARGNKNPADVLSRVNKFITDDIRKGMFVTAFYLILDSRERVISFASAGHNPMILYRGKSQETFYLNPSGFPVGITLPDVNLFSNTIRSDRIRLHPDDILVAYTDGIIEAMNHQRELYGEERFLASVRKNGELDVVEFVKNVKEDILNFTGGYEQNDDITLVALRENMEAVDVKIKMFDELFELANKDDVTVAQACKRIGISTSTYYKYKKIYANGGLENLREILYGYTNISLKHLSIEAKTKIYDIIRENPAYGPKRISNTLNTEKYSFTEITPRSIYEELKRAKLNTRKQRESFVQRGGKRRLKPPGTPLLTLDGEVVIGFRSDEVEQPHTFGVKVPTSSGVTKEKLISVGGKKEKENANGKQDGDAEIESTPDDTGQPVKTDEKTEEFENHDENEESLSDKVDEKQRNID